MPQSISSIYRYPVKGFSPEALDSVQLTAGEGLPNDRRFALARATTVVDPEKPEWQPKTNFFMLRKEEKLAQLHTRFDENSGMFTIECGGEYLLSACITEPRGRASIETFFAAFLSDQAGGPPHIVEVPGHIFTDSSPDPVTRKYKYISLINIESLRDFERAIRAPVDPIRFRGNIYFEGAAAWDEFHWIDSELEIGDARLKVIRPIVRCPATEVNPVTAERDLAVPQLLKKHFSHVFMGVYAEVVQSGFVRLNDKLILI